MQKKWFKAKRYGWGWTPSSWQGWLSLGVFLSIILIGSLFLFGGEPSTPGQVVLFGAWFASCVVCLLIISYRKGEKPSWRWGDKSAPKDKS
jgi:hypothetical protein